MTRSCIHELCALHSVCLLSAALWFLHLCLHFAVVHEKMLPASLSSLSSANPELCYESTAMGMFIIRKRLLNNNLFLCYSLMTRYNHMFTRFY